jgi:hypothetical protein
MERYCIDCKKLSWRCELMAIMKNHLNTIINHYQLIQTI